MNFAFENLTTIQSMTISNSDSEIIRVKPEILWKNAGFVIKFIV